MTLQAHAERPNQTGSGYARFPTARDVFEAFPGLCNEITTKPTDQDPLVFLRSLVSGSTPEDALAFCAHYLPRREAVWWASQCVRALLDKLTEADETALDIAEAWVCEPEEPQRKKALRIAMSADWHAASTWIARAAAWSGGRLMLGVPNSPVAGPDLTAKAVCTALMTALAGKPDRAEKLARCIERGTRIAAG